jgi:hypothetical protein
MERDRGESKLSTVVAVGLLGVIALGVSEYKGWTDFTDLIDVPPIELGSDPEEATAAVDEKSYEVEVDLDISCTKRVSAAVDVEGFKNGPTGDGVFEKKVFGDFLLCSDNAEIKASGVELVNPITNEVETLTVTITGLQVTQPRVELLDIRNCIDGNVGEDMDSINQKVDEYSEKVAAGDEPECDSGFRVTQLFGTDDLAKAKDIGLASAELALTVGSNPVDIIKAADEDYRKQVEDQLEQYDRYSDANVNVIVQRPNDTESVQARLDAISENLSVSFTKIEFGTNDKGNYMYVERADGSRATVILDGYAALEVDELEVVGATTSGSSETPEIASGD